MARQGRSPQEEDKNKEPAGKRFSRLASLRQRAAVGRELGQVGGTRDRWSGGPPGLWVPYVSKAAWVSEGNPCKGGVGQCFSG